MLPAAIGVLSLAAIVFFVGMISARNAARRRRAHAHQDILAVAAADSVKKNPDKENNQENPEAMGMASGSARQHL
jgi:hypothetical protein